MKAVICGIGQRAKVYFSRYEIEKDAIVCLVDKCPNKLYLPAELDGIPFITWDDLARDGTGEKADYFVIASDFYHDEILDSLNKKAQND